MCGDLGGGAAAAVAAAAAAGNAATASEPASRGGRGQHYEGPQFTRQEALQRLRQQDSTLARQREVLTGLDRESSLRFIQVLESHNATLDAITEAGLAARDAAQHAALADCGLQASKRLQRIEQPSIGDFLEALKARFARCSNGGAAAAVADERDGVVELDYKRLGAVAATLLRPVRGPSVLLGPIGAEPRAARAAPQRREREAPAVLTRPKDLDTVQGAAQGLMDSFTSHIMEQMVTCLRALRTPGGDGAAAAAAPATMRTMPSGLRLPVSAFRPLPEVFLDHAGFAQSFENYHALTHLLSQEWLVVWACLEEGWQVAALTREEHADIQRLRRRGRTAAPRAEGSAAAAAATAGAAAGSAAAAATGAGLAPRAAEPANMLPVHMIAALDEEDWEELCREIPPERCLMPSRQYTRNPDVGADVEEPAAAAAQTAGRGAGDGERGGARGRGAGGSGAGPSGSGAGPKVDPTLVALQRREQFGFANMVKEQEFRSTQQGEIKALNDRIRELTDMLEDRKSANRMLNTENQRLKKLTQDLQFQLLNKPTTKGESTALKSMRELAKQFQSQEAMTAARAEKLVTDLMAQNQAAVEEIQQLQQELEATQAELVATRDSLSDASAQISSLLAAQAQLQDEKEELIRTGEQREMESAQALAQLAGEIEALQAQLAQAAVDAEAARVAAEAALRTQKAELLAEALHQRQAAVAEVQAQVGSRSGIAGSTWPSVTGDAAAAAEPQVGAAAAEEPSDAPASAEALGARGNVLELLLHDALLHPGVLGIPTADFWPHLRLACPGLQPPLQHVALVAGPEPQQALTLRTAHRLHFPDDRRLLTEVARGSAVLRLQDLRPAVVGAFGCPRLVPAPVHAGAGAAGGSGTAGGETMREGGDGGVVMVADGTMERVLVVACRDEHDCPSLELFCMDSEGRPTKPFQSLSAPWRLQLPETIPPPGPHEFCLDTHRLHRLQADAARASGLFDTAARVFIGRSDGHTYQVWRLADADARRKASFKALDRVLVHPADDPWAAAAPLATTSLPLTAALSAPTIAQLELRNMRHVLAGEPVVRLYEPSDEIATHALACRTTAGEKLVCHVRVTARLVREPEVSEQLLGALQPALQSGSSAPSLPPLHWLSLLGAEELLLDSLLAQLRAAVAEAAGRLMALPVHGPEAEQQLGELARQAADAVLLKERQLADGLAHCRALVHTAAAFTPDEAQLAAARFEGVREHVARSLAALVAFFRQRMELYRLGAAAWHFITASAGPDDPVARLPATSTPPQAQALAGALHALAAALRALAPPGATATALLAAAAAASGPPLALLLPPARLMAPAGSGTAAVAAARGAHVGATAVAAGAALVEAAGQLEAGLRAAVEAAVAGAGEMAEALRREVAAPGTDDVAAAEAAAVRLASLAAPVTAALVAGLAGVCQAAVAASLAEVDTVAALREQVLAAALVAAATGHAGGATGLTAQSVVHPVGQLTLQLQWQQQAAGAVGTGALLPGSPPPPAAAPARRATAAAQLTATLHSLQWLLGSLARGAAPVAVAASPQSAAAWLRAGSKLRLHAAVLGTGWASAAVAAAGHSLLLTGQRQAAVGLALEVMGREVDRVLDATKAALDAIRVNRSYDEALLSACMPSIANALTSHAAAAVTACFWLACQLLLTPVVVAWQPPAFAGPDAGGDDVVVSQAAALSQAPAAVGTPAGQPAQPAGEAGAAGRAGYGSGSCYSSSLHVASKVSFTMVTLGSMGVGGTAAPPSPPPAAASTLARPADPTLAPLGHPMLTTWQPRGSVLYLDLPRLNAAAAAAAVGAAPDAAPPVDTAALPQLPAAAELLGWSVRHVEEYYHEPASVRSGLGGGGAAAASGARTASVASQGDVGGDLGDAGSAIAALSADPVAVLSEAKLAARMAAEADIVVVAGGRLSEAGSLVKWLSQHGVLVLAASDLLQHGAAAAGSGGGAGIDGGDGGGVGVVQGAGDDGGAKALARTLAGLLASHHLHAAATRALAPRPPPQPRHLRVRP
ncbi:hypothetical protein GPECTOR_30g202 [Gonium pectorale]|uniref:Uncharacterized protein n=1 Tax=Gonium pectorale TaxID=33097 RepID=A0A150GE35_GONPE|nr:hypothetical protein GPECTOR_30g202 [Gonium pectorale]|eukprot:KXZ48107.1 hypothetical protein GPECTOR_30g202 [Gonium pectorale]